MSKKKKSKAKPAVGSPAAGKNNKRENSKPKNQPKQPEPATKAETKAQKKTAPQKPELPKQVEAKPVEPIPAKAKEPKQKKKLSSKAKKIIVATGLASAAVALTVFFVAGNPSVPGDIRNADFKGRLEPDSVAVQSVLSPSQQSKLAKTVKAKGFTGAFDFYVNDEIVIEEHTDPALLELGSVNTNECVITAFLLDENNEVIYRSLGIEPGEEIRSVRLYDSVSYGTQQATLVVNGYDAETYKKIGTQTVKIQLKIGVDKVEE